MNIKLSKNDPNPLGTVLKYLRKQHGFSQTKVAEYLGIHRSTYTKYELGRKPDVAIIAKLSLLYGISADNIIPALYYSEEEDFSKVAEFGSGKNEAFMYILSGDERLLIDYYRRSLRKSDILDTVQSLFLSEETENTKNETDE